MAAGFKRLGILLAAIVLAVAGGALAMTLLISTDFVRHRAADEISRITGLQPVLRGATTVSLFPRGVVSFDDVLLGDVANPVLTARRLTARLRFFPLLAGRVEIADVSLDSPAITVKVGEDGRTNWSPLIGSLARSQKASKDAPAAFSEIRVERGTIIIHQPSHGVIETLRDVEFALAWPSISKSFGASGRFNWHEAPMDATLVLSDFAAALAGERSGVKLRVSGAPLKAAFDGSFSFNPTSKIDGNLAVDSASLRDTLRWIGHRPLPGGGFGQFSLKASASIVGGTISLSGVNAELDGNAAEGVLTFATAGRKTLQGTLAGEKLDLTPYVSTVRLLGTQREWSRNPMTLEGLSGIDFDLRLSAANVTLADAQFGRTAIGATLRSGQLNLAIGESQAYGGIIKGALMLASVERGVDVKTQLQFTDVELESCLGQLIGMRKLEGKGNISLMLEGSGESMMALTRTLNGSAALVSQQGALGGINVEQLLRRLERRPLSVGGQFRGGRTPFDSMSVSLKIEKGTAKVDEMKVEGSAVRLALGGSASIPSRDLDLKGTASLVPVRQDASVFELPFVVQGSWDDPLMLPDPQSLIRRSGASAPLLKRETVRSVIEKLTGVQASAPVPASIEPKPAE